MEIQSLEIHLDDDSLTIETGAELIVFMHLLPDKYHKEIIAQASDGITDLIINDRDFLGILRSTQDIARKNLILAFTNFDRVITQGETLRNSFALLANEQDQRLFLKKIDNEKLRGLISNFEILAECLDWLYGKMDEMFINQVGWDFVANFVSSGESLSGILKSITGREAKRLINHLGWDNINKCIQTSNDLILIFNSLSEENDKLLLENLSVEKLSHVIPTESELLRVCKHLSDTNENLIRKKLDIKLD